MNNGLLYLGGLLTLMLAALFGVPYLIDWNGYRGVFEEEASKVLGRDVRVGGNVNVRLLPTPYVRFEKVRLSDTTGQTGEPFLRADSFTMKLAVAPLLRGSLEANEVELLKPVLSLVVDADGSGNWSTLRLKPANLPFIPQNVALHSVRIVDGAVSVHGPGGVAINRFDDINGELSADSLAGPFKFKGSGNIGGVAKELRLATTAGDGSGGARIKAMLYGGPGDNSYSFDGALQNFAGKPVVSGDLTGKLYLPVPPPERGRD